MDKLLPIAERIAARLIERKETVAVAEGSAGGLISAALLAVPGASAYFMGGAVVYTGAARSAFADISLDDMKKQGIRAASEPYAAMLAARIRERLGTTWALAEAGAAGPTGNRYGDPAGHTCIAVAGPSERTLTLRTGSADRRANMRAFAARALEAFAEQIGAK
jgi:nicotinamide-nucleotide amidase